MGVPALDLIEDEIRRYVVARAAERGVDAEDLGRDDSFVDRHVLDSLALLDLVMHVERSAGIDIPGEDVVPENFGSLAAITEYVRSRVGSP
jgi:acyl carrier protein